MPIDGSAGEAKLVEDSDDELHTLAYLANLFSNAETTDLVEDVNVRLLGERCDLEDPYITTSQMDLRTQGRKLNASREQSFPSHSPRGSFCGGKCLVKADVHNMKSTPPDGNFPHAVAFLNQSYVTSPVVSPTKTSDIPVTSDVGIPSSSTEEACDGPKAAASPLRNEKQAAEDYCHYAGLSTSV